MGLLVCNRKIILKGERKVVMIAITIAKCLDTDPSQGISNEISIAETKNIYHTVTEILLQVRIATYLLCSSHFLCLKSR